MTEVKENEKYPLAIVLHLDKEYSLNSHVSLAQFSLKQEQIVVDDGEDEVVDPFTFEERKTQKIRSIRESSVGIKVLKQLFIYKGCSFDVNEVFGIEGKDS